ncbi:MAG: DUF6345 domain-containing protein [Micromonosporaceae bacterium]
MGTLPIYRVRTDPVPMDTAVEVAERAYRLRDFELSQTDSPDGLITVRGGRSRIEIDGTGMWAADHGLMWRPELTPRLPVPDEAAAIASTFLRTHRLLPALPPGFQCAKMSYGGTRAAMKHHGRRGDKPLDIKVHYGITVLLSEPVPGAGPGGEEARQIPMVGGGGKLSVTIGDRGDVWGHHSAWRPVDGRAGKAEMISRHHADEEFHALTEGLPITGYDARLAYYAAPAFTGQEYLYPVYVYSGVAEIGGQHVPLRQILLPATEFGPRPPEPVPQPPRAADQPVTLLRPPDDRSHDGGRGDGRAGTSWIGLSGGLAGSQANAQGFVDGLARDGWTVAFGWGDGNAWESDWGRHDGLRVDAAFYTGHANPAGWVLANPDDGSLKLAELAGTPHELGGADDLKWAIIAACGPLHDEVISKGGGDVFTRWEAGFDGLHSLLGYGASTYDNTEEGARVVRYGRSGMNLIDAWLRTGQEVQPSTNGAPAPYGPEVWVGAVYVIGSGNDPRDDHLWGHGSVSGEPLNPGTSIALWTTC